MYNIGTVKVAWTKAGKIKEMESLMFDTLPQALDFAKSKKNYMIMKLASQDGDYYKWDVLPYGEYKNYKNGMRIARNSLILIPIAALMIYGAYSLFKVKK